MGLIVGLFFGLLLSHSGNALFQTAGLPATAELAPGGRGKAPGLSAHPHASP